MLKRLSEFITLFSKGLIYGNVINSVGIEGVAPSAFDVL